MVRTAAKIIAVGNLKGGVGKSTLAVNLACAIAADWRRVAIIDTDPQGTATRWAAAGRLPATCRGVPVRDFDGAGEWLDEVDDLGRDHEVLVVDLPAVLSPALGSAFLLADLILVPTSDSEIDLIATTRTVKHVRAARAERAANPPQVLIVPSAVHRRPWDGIGAAPAFLWLGEAVGPAVHRRPEHRAAFAAGDWVGGRAPGSPAHRDILAVKSAALGLIGLEERSVYAGAAGRADGDDVLARARHYLAHLGAGLSAGRIFRAP